MTGSDGNARRGGFEVGDRVRHRLHHPGVIFVVRGRKAEGRGRPQTITCVVADGDDGKEHHFRAERIEAER